MVDFPAGCLLHGDIEAVTLVETHRLGHDDRRGAGDGDEADVHLRLLQWPDLLGQGALQGVEGEPGGDGRRSRALADRGHKAAAGEIAVAKEGAHDRTLDRSFDDIVPAQALRIRVLCGLRACEACRALTRLSAQELQVQPVPWERSLWGL